MLASRRTTLAAVLAPGLLALSQQSASQASTTEQEQVTPEQQAVELYFYKLLDAARRRLDTDLKSELVWYDPRKPAVGTVGDPSKDFSSSGLGALRPGDGRCGSFHPGCERPYDLCPAPGESPGSDLARGCCRHLAYAVPYPRWTALPQLAGRSRVVLSPRAASFPEATWKGVVAHELGHCIDFWLFGRRYGLVDHQATCGSDAELASRLLLLDKSESDPELRADLLADQVLLMDGGDKLCYSPQATLQVLVHDESGAGCGGEQGLLEHWTHPPLLSR